MRAVRKGKVISTSRKIRSIRAAFRREVQGAVLQESVNARREVQKRMEHGPAYNSMFHSSASHTIMGDTGAYAGSVYIMFPRGGSDYNATVVRAQRAYVGHLSRSRHSEYTQDEFERNKLEELKVPSGGGVIRGGVASMLKYADMWESGSQGLYSPVFSPIRWDANKFLLAKIEAIAAKFSSNVTKM